MPSTMPRTLLLVVLLARHQVLLMPLPHLALVEEPPQLVQTMADPAQLAMVDRDQAIQLAQLAMADRLGQAHRMAQFIRY